jgi:hypothetical protein
VGGVTPATVAFFGNFFLVEESDFLFRKPGEKVKDDVGESKDEGDGTEGGGVALIVGNMVDGGNEEGIFGTIGDHADELSLEKELENVV